MSYPLIARLAKAGCGRVGKLKTKTSVPTVMTGTKATAGEMEDEGGWV